MTSCIQYVGKKKINTKSTTLILKIELNLMASNLKESAKDGGNVYIFK